MGLKSQYQVATVNQDLIDEVSTVTFAASSTTSSVLNCSGTAPTGIILPSTWLAGTISFKVSKFQTSSTLVALTNFDGTAFGIVSSAGAQWIPLSPAMFNSIIYLQVISSVSQPAMTVDFALAPIYQGIHN